MPALTAERVRRLFYPRWMLLHLFVIASCIAMVKLGNWQWTVAHRHHGAIQNYSYAFQWWAFVGFAIIMWARVVRDYLRPVGPAAEDVVGNAGGAAPGTSAAAPAPLPAQRYVGYVAPAAAPDTDSERTRFNAYLARLNEESTGATRSDREGSR
jgi:hypothetical protein